MRKLLLAAVVLLLVQGTGRSQNWQQILPLYNAGMYSEALRLLEPFSTPEAEAYKSLSTLKMGTPLAVPAAESFLRQHASCAMAPKVRRELARHLFDAGRYAEALRQMDALPRQEQDAEYWYKTGYCCFSAGNTGAARARLEKVIGLPYSDYSAPAYYLLGYIHYASRSFHQAAPCFEKAAADPRFAQQARYYLLECRFNEKDYAYVLEQGEQLYGQVPPDRRPHLARILGESALVLGEVDKASAYHRGGAAEDTRSDHFWAAQVRYQQQNWQGAVEEFLRMGDRSDSLGQVASYQLGYSYIRLKNKVAAQEAFRQASALSFSAPIREDALYNYAKLCFDLGGNTEPFQQYLNQYGTREKEGQIYTYIAMAALQNRDYEGAVAAYDQIDELEPRMLSNYRKAYFLRARQLMEAGAWRAAIPKLKAAAYYSDKQDGFNQLSRYYLAESYYRDGKWADARSTLVALHNQGALPGQAEGELIPYQIGYAFFKEGDYEKARRWFSTYLTAASPLQAADARMRIADCFFFSGDYASAVEAYKYRIDAFPEDDNTLYARWRGGIALGLKGDEKGKAALLAPSAGARPGTPYYGECLWELGRSYVALKKEADAIRVFSQLESTTHDPVLQDQALLELGLIARNHGRSGEALDYYKQVARRGAESADEALLAIEAIYRTRGNPEEYLAFVNSLGESAGRSEAQKEEVYFSSAEQLYLSGEYAKAQQALDAYLQRYPQPLFKAKAQLYLAECYRAAGAPEAASDAYQAALEAGLDGALAESARLQYAQLSAQLGNYAQAYKSYWKLSQEAVLPQNREAALLGRMRTAFRAREWADAAEDAGAVLALPAAAKPELAREARYIQAKSLLALDRREKALPLLSLLAQEPSTAEGAEATYLLIMDRYDRADFTAVQEQVYAFSEKAGAQDYWLAKAFIALGDAFAEQDNFRQARATFESILEGYTPAGPEDDVLDQVRLRLNKLQ